MITVFPNGGIGNQLFQYSAGRALSLHHNVDLEIDTYHYGGRLGGSDRPFMLHRLNLSARYRLYPSRGMKSPWALPQKFRRRFLQPLLRPVFSDIGFRSADAFFAVPANAILVGYFQSLRFFGPYLERILGEINLRKIASEYAAPWEKSLSPGPWCAIQVRRGDYVGNMEFEMPGREKYYSTAMAKVRNENPNVQFIIFSDEPEWCRKQDIFKDAVIHEQTRPADVADALFLMTLCHHHIIANSSYGWWGAALAKGSSGMVIAPQRWFRSCSIDELGLAFPTWNRL